MKRYTGIFFICAVLLSGGCGKMSGPSKRELITAGPWVMTGDEIVSNGVVSYSFPYFDSCRKDNLWIFTADGMLRITEGALPCGNNRPGMVLEEHTWKFDHYDNRIYYGRAQAHIIELTHTRLVLQYTERVPGRYSVWFKHP